MTSPGWYPDGVTPGVERWFDGSQWHERTRAVNAVRVGADPWRERGAAAASSAFPGGFGTTARGVPTPFGAPAVESSSGGPAAAPMSVPVSAPASVPVPTPAPGFAPRPLPVSEIQGARRSTAWLAVVGGVVAAVLSVWAALTVLG